MRTAILLVLLMLGAPLAVATESPYIGDTELIVQPIGDGTMVNLTEDAFVVPANATILDGWVNISTGANGDGGTGRHWLADDPNLNFSHGNLSDASIEVFDNELTLGVNQTVGRLDDLESLSLRFQRYTSGGNVDVWRMAEPSQFNGPFAMNYSARQAAGGLIPALAPDGTLIAATLPEDPLPAGTFAWISSTASAVPVIAMDWMISFNHWYHLHHLNASTGSSGAWLEVSLDNGVTWNYVTPEGGYPANISTTAPVPQGAAGPGFGVFGGPNASGWVNSTFDISSLHTPSSTNLMHRFVVWTDPSGQVDRPGWYVDEVTLSNQGTTPGSWFHGSLTGEYAADAHAQLTLPLQLNMSGGTSGAWMLRYWTDFDLEGGSWDKYKVRISNDNLSWHRLSPVGGIPGPNGLTVGGRTIMDDTGGWIEVAHPFPSSFTIPANGSVMIRFEVETDQMPSSGYGNALDPPEGIFIDDLSITRTVGGATSTRWSDNLTTPAGGWHGLLTGGSFDQWQHLTGWGNNGPSESTWSFENAPRVALGWTVDTAHGQPWAFGNISNASGWGPSAWPSGTTGAAMGLDFRHAANTWTHLISPAYHIPVGASARVTFDHFICAEVGWDGGVLYTSIDNGTTWQMYGQEIPDFYDVQHWVNAQSPLYQKWVWDGSNQKGGGCQTNKSFTHVEGDLSSFGGQDVMLRFSFFSDTFYESDGWYIDDVGVIVDWFETNGTWTSEVIPGKMWTEAGSLDIDAMVPDGTWVRVSVENSSRFYGGSVENETFPVVFRGVDYRIRIDFGTTNHQLTPRIQGLHQGAVRIFSAADGSNGWDLPAEVNQNRLVGNVTNPTLNTQSIPADPVFGAAPIEAVTISADAAGALFEITDGQGTVLVSGSLTNRTIQLPHAVAVIRPTISLQPGGWIRHASFTGHLGAPMTFASVDIGGDGTEDWSWPPATPFGALGSFGWMTGEVNHARSQGSPWAPDPAWVTDQAWLWYAPVNLSWNWPGGATQTMTAGEMRLLERSPDDLQNVNPSIQLDLYHIGSTWESTFTINGLGPSLRGVQAEAINGTGPGTMVSGDVHIPIVVSADRGGVSIEGSVSHAQRITNGVVWTPVGTMVPDQEVTIITEHRHLFDRSLLDTAILRMQSSQGVAIEVHISELATQPVAIQVFGADEMTLIDVNITELGGDGYRIMWTMAAQWAFDDQDLIEVLAEAIEPDGFTMGPGHGQIGGSNHQAMENDLEVVSWEVRDEAGRLLSNAWDARYPLHARAGSTLDVTGVVRFEGQAGIHPTVDAFRVALESGTTQTLGMSGSGGGFTASLDLPFTPGNITLSPWILQIGPQGVPSLGAVDASGGTLSVEVRIDDAPPSLGPLMIHTPLGGQSADGNILSPNRLLPLWIEVADAELLESFVDLRCWLESHDDMDGDGVPDEDEYGHSNQFIGGTPRGMIRVDFPAMSLTGMEDGDRISCFMEGADFAGYAFVGAGGPGFDADLATMTVETQRPTQVSLPSISLDRHLDMSLLQASAHTFSFTLIDGNGIESIDSIDLDLAGDGRGTLHYEPLLGELSAPPGSELIPLGSTVESLGDDAYAVSLTFAIGFSAPEAWQSGVWVPDLVITEEGEMVSSGALDLDHLSWALDHRLRWVVDEVTDLTAPAMPAYENRVNLQPGDTISLSASVVHRETALPIVIPLPDEDGITLSVLGGILPRELSLDIDEIGFSTTLEFESGNWPGPLHDVQFGLTNRSRWNISLPDLSFEVAIDDVAPRIEFQTTSLVQMRSDALSGQLVSFSVEDAGGMGDQSVNLQWTFRRGGIEVAGAQGEMDLGLGVHSDGSWVYSAYADFTPPLPLMAGDMLLIWVEGQDLAGNSIEGSGSASAPRVPYLEVMHFSPELTSVWVNPSEPEVGDMVRVDVRVTNNGNLAGILTVGLWATEPQPNGADQIVELGEVNLSLDRHEAVLLTFEFEAWREGDLQVYLILDDNPENRMPVDVPPIREEGASLSTLERIFGDGVLALGLLIIACLALGFVGAIFYITRRDVEDEYWPEPPEVFPDQVPPPLPPGLDGSAEEE